MRRALLLSVRRVIVSSRASSNAATPADSVTVSDDLACFSSRNKEQLAEQLAALKAGDYSQAASVAYCLVYGMNVSRIDWQGAFQLLTKAAQQSKHAKHHELLLGVALNYGRGTDKDAQRAKAVWLQSSDPFSQFRVAENKFLDASATTALYAQCVPRLLALAARDHTEALYAIGYAHQLGNGLPRDEAAAIPFFQRGAAQGHAGAQRTLGDCFAAGIGVRADAAKAAQFYRLAAEQGDPSAIDALKKLQPTSRL